MSVLLVIPLEASTQTSRQFRERHKLTFPVLVDDRGRGALQFSYGQFVAAPSHAVIDQKGTIRYFGLGFEGDAIDQTIQQLLRAGKP